MCALPGVSVVGMRHLKQATMERDWSQEKATDRDRLTETLRRRQRLERPNVISILNNYKRLALPEEKRRKILISTVIIHSYCLHVYALRSGVKNFTRG